MVAHDAGFGVALAEGEQHAAEGLLLLRGARVLGLAVGGESADVADADASGVVAPAVRAAFPQGASALDAAVERDDVVVAAAVPALGTVPAVDVGHGERSALARGGTVDDDVVHSVVCFLGCTDLIRGGSCFWDSRTSLELAQAVVHIAGEAKHGGGIDECFAHEVHG